MNHRPVVLVLFALVACKSKEQKLLDENHDEITAALGRLKALAPVVDKQEHLPEANWPVAGVKVGENAGLIWANALTGTCNQMWTTYAPDNSGTDFVALDLYRAEYWFEKPTCAVEGNENLMKGLRKIDVDTLIQMKYALVLRTTIKEPPRLDRGEVTASVDAYKKTGQGTDLKHFVPGHIAGDALLYELSSGKLVGNFPFDAQSSGEVKVGRNFQELTFDLNDQLEKQLQAQLAK